MLQFLPMLIKGINSANKTTADKTSSGDIAGQFMQALGQGGPQSGGGSSQKIGMQYANTGMSLPSTPSAQQMMSAIPQNQNQQTMGQRSAPSTFNPLIQMLLNGGK